MQPAKLETVARRGSQRRIFGKLLWYADFQQRTIDLGALLRIIQDHPAPLQGLKPCHIPFDISMLLILEDYTIG